MKIIKNILSLFNLLRTPNGVQNTLKKVECIAFPRGHDQILEEAEILYAILEKRVTLDNIKEMISITKPMFYVVSILSSDNSQKVSNNIYRKYSQKSISDDDINTIQLFYANYFGAGNMFEESVHSDKLASNEIEIRDEKGVVWGRLNLDNPDVPKSVKMKKHESNYELLYHMLVLSLVVGIDKRLSSKNKKEFSRIVNLPQDTWSNIHYSRFAFLMADWLCDTGESDLGLKILNDIKRLYGGYKTTNGNLYKDPKLCLIFEMHFIGIYKKNLMMNC
jgi:hypothetical protein